MATVRATRITEPIAVDGHLDEGVYSSIAAISGFIQQEPIEGQPSTERTDVWVFYDDRNIYIAAHCWDSEPDREIANEMRRDGNSINDNESFGVLLDTFHDRRNAFLFQTALAGGLTDAYVTDERDYNRDWNTVWNARADRVEDGYTVEFVIPFKSLRYPAGQEQVWGINFKRVIRWKNEVSYLMPVPAGLGRRGFNKVSSAATLVGIQTPRNGRTFEFKPYGISGITTVRPSGSRGISDPNADAGLDVKIGLTGGLTADMTYNTDFAQVEEDEQQVNLTRFNQIFPEKREFFLEGQGIFSFGGLQNQPRSAGAGGSGAAGSTQANPNPTDIPVLFFSRRIGLGSSGPVPIDIGARVSGKSGRYSIGLIDIRTGAVAATGSATAAATAFPATNFGVVRVKRDILRRSAVGVLFTDRSISTLGAGRAQSFGADGAFAFFQNLTINTYVAQTTRPDTEGHALSYRAQLDYNADRYGLQVERLFVDTHFNPDVGFLRRQAFRRDSAFVRFSPRPTHIASVRKFTWDGQFDYTTSPSGQLESRLAQAGFRSEFQNGDVIGVEYAETFELIRAPFPLSGNLSVPAGAYSWPEVHIGYSFSPQRRMSGWVNVDTGRFYDGKRTGFTSGRGRLEITPQIAFEPSLTLNWVDLPSGSFTSALLTTRTTYAMTPRMSTSALIQVNSGASAMSTNVRYRWEYQPGSDLFVVYTDNRDMLGRGFPELRNRGVVVKFTRLFRL
ncbi:MAG: DUF5916 domain-containing protein [Vicinamibacterales bacterium]